MQATKVFFVSLIACQPYLCSTPFEAPLKIQLQEQSPRAQLRTQLNEAILTHDTSTLSSLITGNHVHIESATPEGDVPLLTAAKENRLPAVITLLQLGANPNAASLKPAVNESTTGHNHLALTPRANTPSIGSCRRGWTSIMWAAYHNNNKMLLALMLPRSPNFTPNIHCVDDENNCALLVAAAHGNNKTAHTLLTRGADYLHTNKKGENAYTIARKFPYMQALVKYRQKNDKKNLVTVVADCSRLPKDMLSIVASFMYGNDFPNQPSLTPR